MNAPPPQQRLDSPKQSSAHPRSDKVEAIDQCLPQTQCTKCGYPNCLGYARALAADEAGINQCPPGGTITIHALSQLLNREARPLNPENGVHQPLRLAFIRESDCIGCKLCIAACPVDCIIGSVKLMHTVIATDCSGCELCLPVCPTDCIMLVEPNADEGKAEGRVDGHVAFSAGAPSMWPEFNRAQVEKSRGRARVKSRRLAERERERTQQRHTHFQSSPEQEILAAVKRKQESQQST